MTDLKLACIIPVYNEEEYLELTLNSILAQSRLPDHLLLVDDNSTDRSHFIMSGYAKRYDFISILQTQEKGDHLPGGKVVRAFKQGLRSLTISYDIICKLDADLIFPTNYISEIVKTFESNEGIGIAGGICLVKNGNGWDREVVSDSDHVRGALKSYSSKCFKEIGGLREGMGWDTLDELLAQYYGYKVVCLESLEVKHLKPTGKKYSTKAKLLKGEAFYRMGYGFSLAFLASLKLALNEKSLLQLGHHLTGFLVASFHRMPKMVNKEEESFIRNLRWKRIKSKVFRN